jgi:flagellar motor switch protein FliG
MTNQEKAAILLLSLDEDQAVKVIRNLRSDEIKLLGTHMNRLRNISKEEMHEVAREFCKLAQENGKGIMSVGSDILRNILVKAMGEDKALKVMQSIEDDSFKPYENPVIQKLRTIDPQVIMDFTRAEHPQTIALILANLRPEQAAEILENLPFERQTEIVKRMATLRSVPHEFIDEMARTLESELIVGNTSEQYFGGTNMMAEILNKMNRSSEGAILEFLDESIPELAGEIRSLMFTFDDVFALDDKSIRDILQEVNGEDLARAIKVVDLDMREKIYRNMSKRAAEMLKEDIEFMPPTRLSDVERSQKNIIEVAKRLDAEGRIQISRGNDDDQYV